MKIIKNAIVYSAELPSIDAMRGHLEEFPYKPLGDYTMSDMAFVPMAITAELITPIEGGYAFTIRQDSKIIPAHAINSALADMVASIEKDTGRSVSLRERRELRDEIIMGMLPRALVKTVHVTCIYDTKNQYLIVPVSSKGLADSVVNLIIKAVGSVKTQTIHISNIKNGLTTRLTRFIAGSQDSFEGFTPEGYCQLISPTEKGEKASYHIENLEIAAGAIQDRLASGYVVDRLGLSDGGVSFKLTSDFHFKSISFNQAPEYDDAEEEDIAYRWRHEASVQMHLFSSAINQLVALLKYKEEGQESQEQ